MLLKININYNYSVCQNFKQNVGLNERCNELQYLTISHIISHHPPAIILTQVFYAVLTLILAELFTKHNLFNERLTPKGKE